MRKRLAAFVLVLVLLLSCGSTAFACNESQSNTYVLQILFGDNGNSKAADRKARMLLDALYLCSEQCNGAGQDSLQSLKDERVSGASKLSFLDIKKEFLIECAHNSWEYRSDSVRKEQDNRQKLLRNTVNRVFDFGTFNNWFGKNGGKCNSFAALLYYTHILADCLADDPSETEVVVNGNMVPAYSGDSNCMINGDIPRFSAEQKKSTDWTIQLSDLDDLRRPGPAFAVLGEDVSGPSSSKLPDPIGFLQKKYENVGSGGFLYNRCHLIAQQFCLNDNEENLFTGTTYLNQTSMKDLENMVAKYIEKTGNHVLYRVTPIYKGKNRVASGVQMEAYSVEDAGKGICFNRYCYNVQPGIRINYKDGSNERSDIMTQGKNFLPFVTGINNDTSLIDEMNKHLEILFDDQKDSLEYSEMMREIQACAITARQAMGTDAQSYLKLKECEYQYLKILKNHVPKLLAKEAFFRSAFG